MSIAIADVDAVVTLGRELDRSAAHREPSVYNPARMLPMPQIETLLAVCFLVTSLGAQYPPGPRVLDVSHVETTGGDPDTRIAVRLRDAMEAVRSGNRSRALEHFEAALGLDPVNKEVLRSLVEASRDAPESQALWLRRYWLATMDERGRARLDRNLTTTLQGSLEMSNPEPLAKARAAAIAELERFVTKLPPRGWDALGNGLLARWACDVAIELMRAAPSLRKKYGAAFDEALERHEPDQAAVLTSLAKVMQTSAKNDDSAANDLRMRAARCLTGLGAQAAFKKLEGPKPPDVSRVRALAQTARGKLRAKIEAEAEEETTFRIETLRSMNATEREAFTAEHRHWSKPAIGISPGGLYVVQTTCGHGTLLGALETIELHHRRLANWFGKDPFQSRPGTIRIVPDHAGLESEDSPFWWAGGFQSGDLTVVKFAWGSVAGLGRTLTHELTHRFDGVLEPSLPSWLGEGRAVWTAGAYGNANDERFVDNHLNPYDMQTALVRGYGGGGKLQQLLEGTIDDYRDNYPVGHALFVFLRSWQIEKKRVFEKRLDAYMRRIRAGRKDPHKFFLEHFADGKQGRPDGWDAFLKEWNEFLGGCYKKAWNEEVAWFDERYSRELSRPTRGARVLDRPTFTWTRNRAEPWFGQEHAAEAGPVLAEAGHRREAAAALLWSLRTDGFVFENARLLKSLLEELGQEDAAWALGYELHYQSTSASSPMLPPFAARLSRLFAYAKDLQDAASRAAEAKHGAIARVLANESRWLHRFVGGPSKPIPDATTPLDLALYPRLEAPRRLDLLGLTEEGLTGYEERRVANLWFMDADGNLHVGREKPRDKTGVLDRSIHIRDAYVRANQWQQPGQYVFRTRVHFTTSYVSGAILLGITRRDRNVRVSFNAGDYLYAIGRSDEVKKTDSMRIGVEGLWDREGGLGMSSGSRKFDFARPATSFTLEVRVDGPTAWISVDGRRLCTYTTPSLTPIEGYIGAAMHSGAVRLQEPTVQRIDRGAMAGTASSTGLSLVRPSENLHAILGAPTDGFPTATHGTVVLWLPTKEGEKFEGKSEAIGRRDIDKLIQGPLEYPQKWVIAYPKAWSSARKDRLKIDSAGYGQGRVELVEHDSPAPLGESPWLLFLDDVGVLRVAERLTMKPGGLGTLRRWMRQFRAHETRD
ncbi:MAG: hypothetical protein KDC95_05225 [Planctomycetes bacterium]|nr:hypothetical protein [Planctomycetota bacterium]